MTIIVNGNEVKTADNSTMQQLLQTLSLEGKVMAAAVNMHIVKQAEWQCHIIKEGDKIELLDFVGGG